MLRFKVEDMRNMRNHTNPLKSRNKKLSKSEKKRRIPSAVKIIHEALGQEFYPGTLIKKCPDCSLPFRMEKGRSICDKCGHSKCS
jgi:hypothetical protein